ncbi:MAG: dienelactone hydrolase family protein, partial [Phycisphaerales bacterium]|nr:dienelactone hydrolase family protein [Phycisphaerales bacterium]
DLNDMPALRLPRGAELLRVKKLYNNQIYTAHLDGPLSSGKTVDLYWDELAVSEQDAEELLRVLANVLAVTARPGFKEELEAGEIRWGDHTLRILEKTFGDEPEGGHSLWISMHGGGGAPTEINDKQWQNQIKLYEPAEGVYVAPRAPTDTWNLWHQSHIDPLFDRLITAYVTERGVNPDRVYLMGYSAGGDGVFQLAPRMADRFAAAAMMAGHPNETKPLGLRNLPFAILMGGEDAAYDRNKVAARWVDELAALQESDPGGYPHRVEIYEGMGHWMQRKDAEILPWMARHERKPWPRRVVWHQDDVTHTRFYWLAVDEAKQRTTIEAEIDGQTVSIHTDDVNSITLRLRDEIIDLERPVKVLVNGRQVFEGVVPRTVAAIRRSLDERLDPSTAATALLELTW